jgi:hypothetical protein
MSELGQERRFGLMSAISGLPLTADMWTNAGFRRYGPRSLHRLLSTGSASELQPQLFRIHDSISAVTCAATEEARLWRA